MGSLGTRPRWRLDTAGSRRSYGDPLGIDVVIEGVQRPTGQYSRFILYLTRISVPSSM